jgi:hypothetical protein
MPVIGRCRPPPLPTWCTLSPTLITPSHRPQNPLTHGSLMLRSKEELAAKAEKICAVCRRSSNANLKAFPDQPITSGRKIRTLATASVDKILRLVYLVDTGLDTKLGDKTTVSSLLKMSGKEWTELDERLTGLAGGGFDAWSDSADSKPAG